MLLQQLLKAAAGRAQPRPQPYAPDLSAVAPGPGSRAHAALPRDRALDAVAQVDELDEFFKLSVTEQLKRIEDALTELPPEQVTLVMGVLKKDLARLWLPLPGPQTRAYNSPADVMLYGGSAGSGKTDLAAGLAITAHQRSLICRREYGELDSLRERCFEIVGGRSGYNGQDDVLRLKDNRRIEFFAAKNPGDERKQQGQPKDLLVIDEAVHWRMPMIRYLMGWVRTTTAGQRARVVLCTNPPTAYEDNGDGGAGLVKMFAPWLDESFPDRAGPGELRWVISDKDGDDRWVEGPGLYPVEGQDDPVPAMSRTFVPGKVDDNPYLIRTGYKAGLQNLEEPLRSILLKGDWLAASVDNAWQVIPTDWVKAAQDRWRIRNEARPGPPAGRTMTCVGVDISEGGNDETIIAPRYGTWFAPLVARKGLDTRDSQLMAGLIFSNMKDDCVAAIDLGGGWGSGPYGALKSMNIAVEDFKGIEQTQARSADGKHGFFNRRAETYWKLREALDPVTGMHLELPPDSMLLGDLTAPRWKLTTKGYQIEPKENVRSRLGRSPDRGDAVTMAFHYGGAHELQAKELREMRVTPVLGYANVKTAGRPQQAGRVNLGYRHGRR